MSMSTPAPSERRIPLERLRGMVDFDPAAYQVRQQVLARIQGIFAGHGYRQVETPVIEPTDLFLRKSGGDRINQMYAVHYRDHDIALRPEHTASILRFYVGSMQSEPLPVRLMYAGPVFRYEKPQASRSRQFTEAGCELLGAAGPAADAEVIHLALEGLAATGITGRLVLGHIGIVLDFLDRLPLRQRARDWLVWSMERLRKGQPVDVEADLAGLTDTGRLSDLFNEMSGSLRDVPDEQLHDWVMAVLREVGVHMEGGTRSPEEIVAGVIAKISRQSDAEDVRRAFAFVRELVEIRGKPSTVLPALHSLVARHHLHPEPISQLEQVLDLLTAYGYETEEIELDLGLGRGLHYYTGILFEIYAAGSPSLQLCGGGRYDDLAQVLGARQALPACGFSYGLERVIDAAGWAIEPEPVQALVVAANSGAAAEAIRVSEQLRAEGLRVEVDVRGRSVEANRRYARRRGIARLVVVRGTDDIEHYDLRGLVTAGGNHQDVEEKVRG